MDNTTMADYNTFLATTAMHGEVDTMVFTGGETTAFYQLPKDKLGPQGEVHEALPIPVRAVGLDSQDLATAAPIPLQPPPTGQDWEQLPPAALYYIFSTNTSDHTTTGYHGQLEVLGEDPAKQPVSLAVLVSMGEGKIDGSDVRRPATLPLTSSHCTASRGHYGHTVDRPAAVQ